MKILIAALLPPPPSSLGFPRHDWVVKRADGTEARYVIDFYAGKPPPGSTMPVAMHLDVRPALDSVDVRQDKTHYTSIVHFGLHYFFKCQLYHFLFPFFL